MNSTAGTLPPVLRPASSTSPEKGVVMHQPIMYTTDEVKQMLGCEEDTVRNLLQDGLLACVKVGRSWVFPCTAFEASLNQMALDDTSTRRDACLQRTARNNARPALVNQPIVASSRRRIMPVLQSPEHAPHAKK